MKVKLGELIEQIRGVSYKPEDLHPALDEDSVILLRANNIQEGRLCFDDVVYVDKKRIKNNQLLQAGDVLICTSSGSKELVGKACYVPENMNVTFGAFCKVVRPKTGATKYLAHYFQSPNYRSRISKLSAGANINNIRNEHIDKLVINYPDMRTQEEAINRLDCVSDLMIFQKEQLQKLDELVKSRFIELFGNIDSKVKVSSVAKVSGGYAFKSNDIGDSGVRILQIGNVALMDVDWSTSNFLPLSFLSEYSQFALSTNDIVMALTRPIIRSLGNVKTCMVREQDLPCLLNQRVGRISAFSANKQYLYYCFMMDEFTRYVDECSIGCSQPNISTKDIENYLIPNAPMELQNEFTAFVEQTDKLKLEVKQSLDKLETLKKSLMQEYFG